MPNRLAQSTSPYLQQHADNPVDWWPWGEEAFDEARRRDVPIFLSIGYSACHWCHVMAHESFEDPRLAAYLNAHFVSIKVDREERPDVDTIYMDATVALTGHGGWPMSVFLDHAAQPFLAGTYYPPEPRHGMPSFGQLLAAITEAWTERREEVNAAGGRILEVLARRQPPSGAGHVAPTADQLDEAVRVLGTQYDPRAHGFGGAPKFPPSMLLEFLLRHHARTASPQSLAMVEGTLTAMARGGIYDQIGGGFARYSVDADWVVPHFEKMLYDNALLLRAYLHWWRATGSELAERIVRETAEFVLTDLRTAEGGFAAALDADSEGEEGRFYVWTRPQLIEVLGEQDGAWAADLLNVTESGTFEHGTSTLQLLVDPDDAGRWQLCRATLHRARATRIAPGRDDKIVAAWNGLMIAALAEAGALLEEPAWVEAAIAAADLLLAVHLGAETAADGDRLVRTSRDGIAGDTDGVLEDYADVAEGLLALYTVTGDDTWLALAGVLLDVVLEHFADGEGGFFDTADDAEALVRRPRDPADGPSPSGWAAAAQTLLTYAALTGSSEHRQAAEGALAVVTSLADRAPRAVGWGLAAAEALLDGPRQVAVVGRIGSEDTAALRRTALMATAPGCVVAIGEPSADADAVPLLQDRPLIAGRAAAYVCRGFTCDLPATSAEVLAAQVGARLTGVSPSR